MAKADTETPAVETPEVETPEVAAPVRDANTVSYRVLKAGDGMVHTGGFNTELAEPETYSKGDIVEGCPRKIAEELEERHFVEILED